MIVPADTSAVKISSVWLWRFQLYNLVTDRCMDRGVLIINRFPFLPFGYPIQTSKGESFRKKNWRVSVKSAAYSPFLPKRLTLEFHFQNHKLFCFTKKTKSTSYKSSVIAFYKSQANYLQVIFLSVSYAINYPDAKYVVAEPSKFFKALDLL